MPVNLTSFQSRFDTPRFQISTEVWKSQGLSVFGTENVPFSGRTSHLFASNLVKLFVARTKERRPADSPDYHVYELGIGTGILARRFLDILKAKHAKLYDHTTFHLSDISIPLIRKLMDLSYFKNHIGHVKFEVADAQQPVFSTTPFFVYHTYLADSLPLRHIRITGGKAYEVTIRTQVDNQAQLVDSTRFPPRALSARQIKNIFAKDMLADYIDLSHHFLGLFQEQTKLLALDQINNWHQGEKKDLMELITTIGNDCVFNYSFGLRQGTKRILDKLDPEGFLVISDFGRTLLDNVPEQSLLSQFGTTCPATVHFPLIASLVTNKTHFLTTHPQGSPQVLLIDSRSGTTKLKPLFSRLFSHYERPDLEAYLKLAAQISAGKNPTPARFRKLWRSIPKPLRSDFQLINNFAQFFLQANLPEQAIEFADLVLEYHHHIALTAYRIKAMAYSQIGEPQLMEQNFKQALQISPGDYQTLSFLAEIYWTQNRFTDFLRIMHQYLRHTRNNDYIKSLVYTSKALWNIGAHDESVKLLKATIKFGDNLYKKTKEDQQLLESACQQLSTNPIQTKS